MSAPCVTLGRHANLSLLLEGYFSLLQRKSSTVDRGKADRMIAMLWTASVLTYSHSEMVNTH